MVGSFLECEYSKKLFAIVHEGTLWGELEEILTLNFQNPNIFPALEKCFKLKARLTVSNRVIRLGSDLKESGTDKYLEIGQNFTLKEHYHLKDGGKFNQIGSRSYPNISIHIERKSRHLWDEYEF